jgi:hypothetical protein
MSFKRAIGPAWAIRCRVCCGLGVRVGAALMCIKAAGSRSHSRCGRVSLVLRRADFIGNRASRPGPPRPNQHEPHLARRIVQTVIRDSFRRGCSPNRAAKRSPDSKAVGVAFPGPVPRIVSSPARLLVLQRSDWARCYAWRRVLPSRRDRTTGGDANPDCRSTLLGVIRFGWPSWALRLSSDPRVGCPTVAGRRFPPCPLSLVSHGQFCCIENRTPSYEAFLISPRVLPLDDARISTAPRSIPSVFSTSAKKLSTAAS